MARIEKEWTTKAGLPAVVRLPRNEIGESWRCGYVGVSKEHPFYGLMYHTPTKLIKPRWILRQRVGKRSPLSLLCSTIGTSEGEVARTLELLIDVHGSLTFSGKLPERPDDEYWWFGFDCAHSDDDYFLDPEGSVPAGPSARDLDYVVEECERLAEQLQRWAKESQKGRRRKRRATNTATTPYRGPQNKRR